MIVAQRLASIPNTPEIRFAVRVFITPTPTLLNLKADLERELGDFVLDSSRCGPTITGLGARCHTRTLGAPGARAARRASDRRDAWV